MECKTKIYLIGALGLACSAGYALRVLADGAPTMAPIFYSGNLDIEGQPASGLFTITLKLYDAETAGNELCSSETRDTRVDRGSFRIEVASPCVERMKTVPDVWVGLEFTDSGTGTTRRLPTRTKAGAVPYAMEAQHAVTSSAATSASGPLEARLSSLEAQLAELRSKPSSLVESGALGSGAGDNTWTLHTGMGERLYSRRINFTKTFRAPPQVVASLTYIDASGPQVRVVAAVGSIDQTGFTLTLGTWANSAVFQAVAAWTAIGE